MKLTALAAGLCLVAGIANAHEIIGTPAVGHVIPGHSEIGWADIQYGADAPNMGQIVIAVGSASFSGPVNLDEMTIGFRLKSFTAPNSRRTCVLTLQDGPLHVDWSGNQVRNKWPRGSYPVLEIDENDVKNNAAYVRIENARTDGAFVPGTVLAVNVQCSPK